MAYGKIKADTLVYDNSGTDVERSVASLVDTEGTAVKSTGESGTTKFLRVDGDGTCSWQVPPDTNTQLTLKDEDDFASDSNTAAASQQSIKAYVDAVDTAKANLSGATFTGDVTLTGAANNVVWDKSDNALEFAANAKSVYGSALEISHNGSHSIINDGGTGNLRLQCAGNTKIEVTTTGIDVTGTAIVDGITIDGAIEQVAEAVAALEIDCSAGNYFTKTISGNSTFTFANPAASGTVTSFTLELTHSSGTVTWPASVKWNGDTAPTLTTGKTHLFMFVTDDGGTRYRGAALVDYVN